MSSGTTKKHLQVFTTAVNGNELLKFQIKKRANPVTISITNMYVDACNERGSDYYFNQLNQN